MNSHLNNAFSTELEPTVFFLGQNYPNPFKEKTKIKFCVAIATRVKLTVYNAEGKIIKKLVDEEKDPGTYEVEFSACHFHESGNLKEEMYYYHFEAGDYKCEKTMQSLK